MKKVPQFISDLAPTLAGHVARVQNIMTRFYEPVDASNFPETEFVGLVVFKPSEGATEKIVQLMNHLESRHQYLCSLSLGKLNAEATMSNTEAKSLVKAAAVSRDEIFMNFSDKPFVFYICCDRNIHFEFYDEEIKLKVTEFLTTKGFEEISPQDCGKSRVSIEVYN